MRIDTWLTRRLRALFRRSVVEREMQDELRLHLEMVTADAIRRGLAPGDARAEARRAFGGMEQVKEAYRDARGVRPVEQLVQDVRYAFRTLRRAPGFTIVVLLTLTLGIGANTAIFSIVHGVLLRELPYADVDRVVMVWETDRDSGTDSEAASVPDYYDFLARAQSFVHLAGFEPRQLNLLTAEGVPERVTAVRVTADFLAALGISPIAGRDFLPQEDRRGGPRAVLVSERFWHTRLGGAPAALGSTVRLDDSLYTVVGVLPRRMQFPAAETDVWIPLRLTPASAPRSRHSIQLVGRLRTEATLASAQSEMSAIAAALEREYPSDNDARGVRLEPLRDTLLGDVRPAMLVLLAAVALVLLVTCVNVANLMLARLAARQREVAVRTALGATGGRLTQQFVVESLLLTLGAGLLAIAVAPAVLRGLVALAPASLPRLGEVRLDGAVLSLTLAIAVATALVFGVLPALARQRFTPADTLRGGGQRGGLSREHHRLRGVLVVAELALAIVLVIGAGLFAKSFWRLRRVDPGWVSGNLLRLKFHLPESRYPQDYAEFPRGGWRRIVDFERELVERVSALPGVRAAAVAASDPLGAGFANSFVIEGKEALAAGQAELATRPVSATYFTTVGVPLLRGRMFEATDDAGSAPVLVINEAAAHKYFPNEDPIGRRLRFWGVWRTIVGVVGNERFAGLASEPPPAMYPAIAQAPMATANLLVRTTDDPQRFLPAVREALWSIDRQVAPFGISTMDEALDASIAQQRFLTLLTTSFAVLAFVLALVGIYGVVSFGVAQRTHEIGVRMALGATRAAVVRHVVAQGARLALVGATLGAAAALAGTRLLASQLYHVTPTDPLTFAGAVGLLLAAAVLGSYLPARRAASVSPMVALRSD